MSAAVPGEIRTARLYLQKRGVRSSDISPHRFVAASKELGKDYAATLKYLVLLLSGGSGLGPSRIATANEDRLDPIKALGKPSPDQEMSYDVSRGQDS